MTILADFLESPEQSEAVQSGHDEIAQHDVRAELREHLKGVLAVLGGFDDVAPAGQQLLEPYARGRVVFDDENADAVIRRGDLGWHGGSRESSYLLWRDSAPMASESENAAPGAGARSYLTTTLPLVSNRLKSEYVARQFTFDIDSVSLNCDR